MKLIVGLGNPDKEFKNTRHNLGFIIIDYLMNKMKLETMQLDFKGLFSISFYQDKKIILLKPQNYMNNSGFCVKDFIEYYSIPIQDVIIIYDDLYTNIGKWKLRENSTSGGHKGMQNIIEHLGTNKITRIKVGIGPNESNLPLEKWVLQDFSVLEKKIIDDELDDIINGVLKWIEN